MSSVETTSFYNDELLKTPRRSVRVFRSQSNPIRLMPGHGENDDRIADPYSKFLSSSSNYYDLRKVQRHRWPDSSQQQASKKFVSGIIQHLTTIKDYERKGLKSPYELRYINESLVFRKKTNYLFKLFRRSEDSEDVLLQTVEKVKALFRQEIQTITAETIYNKEKEDKTFRLVEVLQLFIDTQYGKNLLEQANEDLKKQFAALYCELSDWNKVENKLNGALEFWKESEKKIDSLIRNIGELQKKEISKKFHQEEFLLTDDTMKEFQRKIKLKRKFPNINAIQLQDLADEIFNNPKQLHYPYEHFVCKMNMSGCFNQLQKNYDDVFKDFKEDDFKYIIDEKLADRINKTGGSLNKIYIPIRSILLTLVDRLGYYYAKKEDPLIKEWNDRLKKAMVVESSVWNWQDAALVIDEMEEYRKTVWLENIAKKNKKQRQA